MYLSPKENEKANKVHQLIKNHFHDHRLCNKCEGTGLDNFSSVNGDHSWDGHTFCDTCKGIGFLSWKDTVALKLCPKCKGGGVHNNRKCVYCEGEGILDWIQYMRVGET
jgi:DnaJ-class molecular chaperone